MCFAVRWGRVLVVSFELRIGESWLRHSAAAGAIAGDGHEASWNLEWTPPAETHLEEVTSWRLPDGLQPERDHHRNWQRVVGSWDHKLHAFGL